LKLSCLAALLAAPLAVAAADATDPAAAVAPLAYRSVFEGIPRGVEEETVDWKKANADVAQFPRGHADLLKWEEAGGAVPPAAAPAPAPAPAPRPAPAPAPAPPPAAGHRH
jgi:hypothetical protein